MKALRSFLSNEEFYNLLADPKKSLLSVKEKLKGRVLPYAALAALAAVSIAVTAATAGAAFVPVLLAFPPLTLGIVEAKMRLSYRALKNPKKFTAYNLNTAAGRDRFKNDFPERPDFPAAYGLLAKNMGFAEAPVLYTEPWLLAYATVSSLLPGPQAAVVLGRVLLRTHSHEDVVGIAAHELGHLQKKHIPKRLPDDLLAGWTHCFAPLAGLGVALAGGLAAAAVAGGILFAAAGIGAASFMRAKISQYDEREADRISLVQTGLTAWAGNLERSPPRWQTSPKGLADHFRKAVRALTARHPFSHSRAGYARDFARANEAYCRETSAPFRQGPAPVPAPVPALTPAAPPAPL